MMLFRGLCIAALIGAATARPAMAGFINNSWGTSNQPNNDLTNAGWAWTPQTDINNNIVQLDLHDWGQRTGNSTTASNVWGDIDADPVIHIIEDLTNSTGGAWTGYDIKIIPDAFSTISLLSVLSITVSSGSSTAPGYTIAPSGDEIIMTGGNIIPGDTLSVDFKYNVNTSDPLEHFSYTIDNTPIPEPASLGMLGLGAFGLLLRRRHLKG